MWSSSGNSSVILYAEVPEASTQTQSDGSIMRERVDGVFRRLAATVARYHGNSSDQGDDAVLAEFDRPLDAVVVALAFQATQREYLDQIDDGIKPVVQIGVALDHELGGEASGEEAVSTEMQRLAGLAEPGEVVITSAICDSLSEQSPVELGFLGEHRFDENRGAVEVYRIGLKEGAELPPPASQVRKTKPLQPLGTMRLLNRYLLLFIVMAAVFAYFSASG